MLPNKQAYHTATISHDPPCSQVACASNERQPGPLVRTTAAGAITSASGSSMDEGELLTPSEPQADYNYASIAAWVGSAVAFGLGEMPSQVQALHTLMYNPPPIHTC